MSSKLTKFDGKQSRNELITFTQDQLDLIKSTIAKDATNDELQLFLYQCKRSGLDPIVKQIYFQKYKSKNGQSNMTIITGIDGYRLIADRSNAYGGSHEPIYDGEIKITDRGAYDLIEKAPRKATVTVVKFVDGVKCKFTASAFWEEYYPGGTKGHMWRKFPYTMLAKCAESQALRKAFPNDLSGLYTTEEMEQAPRVENVTLPTELLVYDDASKERAIKRLMENPSNVENLIEKIKQNYELSDEEANKLRGTANMYANKQSTEV